MDFCHLHLHTTNSRLDGMINIPELVDHCIANDMSSCAILDHGNMSGAIEFYTEARSKGLNPIIGQEIYLVDDHTQKEGERYHEGLLAMDWEGYRNLVKLSSAGFCDGLRRNYFACIDDDQISTHSAGIICLSGCISSRLARTILRGLEARDSLETLCADAHIYSESQDAFTTARRRVQSLAVTAASALGSKKNRLILEAREQHTILDQIAAAIAGDYLPRFIDEKRQESEAIWSHAWTSARSIVEKRLECFGNRYYLETQVIPSTDQILYNQYVRQLSEMYNIPCVVTADAHYLRREDAALHRAMLQVRTAKRKEKKEEKVITLPEFPDDESAAILGSDGEVATLETLYDEIITDQMACTGKKYRLDTKAHADRRNKWVKLAQIYYLSKTGGDIEVPEDTEVELDEGQLADAIDSGRAFSDWAPEFWVRTPQEMLDGGALQSEIDNTVKLAKRCDIQIPINTDKVRIVHMPDFELPEKEVTDEADITGVGTWDHDSYLASLCNESLRHYLDENTELEETKYRSRLDYELRVIAESGFSKYFLIVWDYIKYTRDSGGLTGPGRGSAAASLVTFLLGITRRIDPLMYPDLMFERFLTPGRPDLPDIDTDFDYQSAEMVFQYCQSKYGEANVTKIGTFSKIGARTALHDIGTVLNIPYIDIERASKALADFKPDEELVQEDNKALFSLEEVAQANPELLALSSKDPLYRQWFSFANGLQGIRRNASQHASGVAIADMPLQELGIPLMATVVGKYRIVTTQFDMDDLALLGIPKFDQLKLSSLTILSEAERLIGDDFSLNEIPLDDSTTFGALSRGDNLGIFQVAQGKVRGVLRAVAPRELADIAAVITIIRPGLFAKDRDTGLTQEELYKARRQGSLPVRYQFPFLQPILATTQGVMIYQEQVLKVCWAAGMSQLEADKLRKVLSKKQMSKAREFEEKFTSGAKANLGLSEQEATDLWDLVVEFAAYGFNAAHAYAYGLIAYWTSYLKTHYPAQFMAATLSVTSSKATKAAKELLPRLLEDCRQLGRSIPILAPCVNTSQEGFSIEYTETKEGLEGAIRFGLGGIKGIGSLATAIISQRQSSGPYTSLTDFDSRLTQRMDRRPSKTALNALALSGAMDQLFTHRSEALFEIALAREDVKYKKEIIRQAGWKPERRAVLAQKQAELCGNYYFVRDNIDVLGQEVDNFFISCKDDRITIGGRVLDCKLDRTSRSGSRYHRVTVRTQWGDVSTDFYPPRKAKDPGTYLSSIKDKLFKGAVVMVTGAVRDEHSMWGHSIQLPSPEFRGIMTEEPGILKKAAEEILQETGI